MSVGQALFPGRNAEIGGQLTCLAKFGRRRNDAGVLHSPRELDRGDEACLVATSYGPEGSQ